MRRVFVFDKQQWLASSERKVSDANVAAAARRLNMVLKMRRKVKELQETQKVSLSLPRHSVLILLSGDVLTLCRAYDSSRGSLARK
jgi:hypothetical protein